MILDEITLHNFGLYAGRQTITLTPPSRGKPIILFGGLNGAGKTTLLDALQLCLFGPHAKISTRSSLAYAEYLSRCIHKRATKPEASIEISFRQMVEGNEDHYELNRSWRRTSGSCNEYFEVWKNGQLVPALADNWASQVEDFLPSNIAHLFLFDGEQIERFASPAESSSLIGTAIKNLLGLDIVDQLEKDLQVYERRKRTEAKSESARSEITALEIELRDLRTRADALRQDRAALRTHQIDRKHRALAQIEDRYRKLGGELYEQRVEIEHRLIRAEQLVRDGAAVLREIASGSLPLLMVYKLLESIKSRDRQEEECRRAREMFEALRSRDRATLQHLRSHSIGANAISTLRIYFDQDRKERQALGDQEIVLSLLPEVRGDIRDLLGGNLDEQKAKAVNCLKRQHKVVSDAARARIEYENVPTADIIAEIASERDAIRREIATVEAQHESLGNEIQRLEREIARKEHALERLLGAHVHDIGKRRDRSRILRHASKVRATLGLFRHAVVERHIRRIEQVVLDSYQQLLRKSTLVTSLSIDPTRFYLTLYGDNGQVLTAERLSAGERQLLAIALLWGLAKASGRPLPTAIDTPLGRLDSGHRMHIVERYFPFASHQLLLLSTDEEINDGYLERLRPWIGRSYHLAYDEEAGHTRIFPGYFN